MKLCFLGPEADDNVTYNNFNVKIYSKYKRYQMTYNGLGI